MLTYLTPDTICPPFAKYSHAVEVPEGMRLIACSGQLGITADKQIPPDTETQTRLCFDNIRAILGEAGMDLSNIVRINAYVTGREHLKPYMKVRDELFGDPAPASTLIIVSGFAREEFHVEIEALAAGLPR
ncbi:MAG: RidA family protein [Pseudomonadota bacterium]